VQAPIVHELVLTFLHRGAVVFGAGQVGQRDLEEAISLLVAVEKLSSI